MHPAFVAFVVGTRPEAIKLASIARALMARAIPARLFATGQHPGLEVEEHGFPELPTIELGCAGIDDPFAHASLVAEALAPLIGAASLVLVQGDTSSAFGGALAAQSASVPVAHVEAGLRSHDSRNPWPEEDFRRRIDRISSLLFAPTQLSAANLRREGVAGAIHVTGNSGIDAALGKASRSGRLREGPPRLLVTCHRRESWGEGLASIAGALREIAAGGAAQITFVLHPNPRASWAMRDMLSGAGAIELRPPCGHRQMLQLMADADLVLTDSGGLQEEAPLFGIPLLLLRQRTERPEAIASGNMELVGTDRATIVAATMRLLDDPQRLARMSRKSQPFGDGKAAERIAEIIVEWLAERGQVALLPAAE